MTDPRHEHVAPVDILGAVFEFVAAHAAPKIDPDRIYRGWQNRMALPSDSQEFCIISITTSTRRGTVDTSWQIDNESGWGRETIKSTQNVDVQIDFFGESDTARLQAQSIDALAGSRIGATFFRDRGLSCLYADQVRDMTFSSDDDQFLPRFMVTLHLCAEVDLDAEIDGFNTVHIDKIKDVDTYLSH